MDNEYNIYNETPAAENDPAKKTVHVPSLVLMIIGAVFALMFILPIITYGCSIPSLVMSIKRRKTHVTLYAIIINIIALILAVASSVIGVMASLSMMGGIG